MYKSVKSFIVLIIFSSLLILFTLYSCGGDGGDSSTNSDSQSLSTINGRVAEVLALSPQNKTSLYARMKNLVVVIPDARAQGFNLDGITVAALKQVSNGEQFLDEDITFIDGSFNLFVPAGEILLRFQVDDDVFEESMQVPENSTVEILVSIDPDNTENPVEITGPEENDNEDENEENTDDLADEPEDTEEENDVPEPTGNGDAQDMEDEETGDDDDDSQGNNDPPASENGNITSAELVTSVNTRRAQGANCGSEGSFGQAGSMDVSNALGNAALRHSRDMADNDFFSHTGSDGSSPIDRMRDAGFNGNGWGENISSFTFERNAEQVVQGWMDSDGHCANIMNPNFNILGSAKASNSTWEYWTLNLGTE